MFGAIEAGGTKFVLGVGTGPDDLQTLQVPTTSPQASLAAVIAFFREHRQNLRAIGIGSFGPVDLRPQSPTFGYITSTPKPGWQNFDIAGIIRREFNLPVGFDTDVDAAALGEERWGAARGLSDFVYLTVGTGIGGGAMVGGRILHGLMHPEMGHLRLPHDWATDPYPGGCPFHGDCLEGLASGPAIHARWGISASELSPDHPGMRLEARYLALGVANIVMTLSPQRVLIGGGVMQQSKLFDLVRQEFAGLLNGYIRMPELLEGLDHFIVPPALGNRAGVLGALVLAEQAYAHQQ